MRFKHVIAFFVGFMLSGCAVTDFDPTADFAKYRTYTWGESNVDVENPLYDSELIHKHIRQTIDEEFQKRGIVRAERNPDFIVLYHTYTEDKMEQSGGHPYPYRFYPYGFYPYGFHPFAWGYPYWVAPPYAREYTEGTLIIDIIDRRSDELVWRGSVSGNVDNVSALRKQIEKGVRAIMKKYPVSPDDRLPLDYRDVTA